MDKSDSWIQAPGPAGDAWALLLTVQSRLIARIEEALAEAGLPSLVWYDVLWELEKADGGRLRMHELAGRTVLSRPNLTRLADRLESAGLISREPSVEDRRGLYCTLTPSGRDMRAKMWPAYAQQIEALFARHVSPEEARAMCSALKRILAAAAQPA